MTNEHLAATAATENLTDKLTINTQYDKGTVTLYDDPGNKYAHLSDFELDLKIISEYIDDSMGNIVNRDSLNKATEYLKTYKTSEDNLEQAKSIINILVLTLDDLFLRFYAEQDYINKKLKKLKTKTKHSKGLLSGEFSLINDLKETIIY